MKKVVCWNCGRSTTEYESFNYDVQGSMRDGDFIQIEKPNARKYCLECFEKVKAKDKEEHDLFIRLKKREMFKRACETLEKQNTKMYDFQEAINAVEEVVNEKPDKFDSSYEVLAAIVLVKNRIYSKMQYKIGPYQVDFLLPEIGVVLEIDGERHKQKKDYDSKRDAFIKQKLGYGWDIIRINTDYLDMKAERLPEAIERVVEYRETNHIPWRKVSQ